ncbi:hypothetical protein [Variovorax sp. JS1663]|uniref:hypothetical protein n=1 Tax=Variovorax sp. JS1663 TaxID=1851577 RepID=UPI000B348861|nr:hypothetical protein [Variovorax sp. JS1663]OUM00368.1 hypothetical protein A8M77_21155 [Variovorax sp. JS1663]
MAAYLQQGHGSWGLLEEADIGDYRGLVISPVNDGPNAVRSGLARLRDRRESLEVILDPQLYNPTVDKGKLAEWTYYSADFETANHSDLGWWATRGREVVNDARSLGIDAVCSPALFPRDFSDDYYRLIVDVADATAAYAGENGIDTLVTAMISLRDLATPARAQQIGSILSSTDCERVYLTFLAGEIEPRQPLDDGAALATAVHLVKLLSSQLRVHVAFCAHDLVMWKAAGVADASSGKYFNLRRFVPSRWRDEDGAGRLVPYWNEADLATVIRDQEVLRLDRERWFADRNFGSDPYGVQILDILRAGEGEAWQKLSWLQYLRWFAEVEGVFTRSGEAEKALEMWDARWGEIHTKRILFADRSDGRHVRTWLNAVREGTSR